MISSYISSHQCSTNYKATFTPSKDVYSVSLSLVSGSMRLQDENYSAIHSANWPNCTVERCYRYIKYIYSTCIYIIRKLAKIKASLDLVSHLNDYLILYI